MNILYITQILPYPPDTGGNIKSFQTISILKKLGHEVSLFSFVKDNKKLIYEDEFKKRKIKIGKIFENPFLSTSNKSVSYLSKLIKFFCNLFSVKPFTVEKLSYPKMYSSILDYLKKENVDCIWISYFSMTQYLPNDFRGLRILELHDINSTFFRQMFLKDSFFHWKIYAFFEWIKFYFYEKRLLQKFDKIFTISLADKKRLENIVEKSKIDILPPFITPKKIKSKEKNRLFNLLFVGNLCWYPNKDGIYWFLKKIYPRIKKFVPEVTVKIVGQIPQRNIFPSNERILFYNYQQNLKNFWEEDSVFIVPIRYGSGIRLKILEAMSYELPIVTTSEGAEGLNVIADKELLIARDEKEFANKTIDLLENKVLQKNLVRNAYKFLKANYSQKNVADSLSILTKYPIHE